MVAAPDALDADHIRVHLCANSGYPPDEINQAIADALEAGDLVEVEAAMSSPTTPDRVTARTLDDSTIRHHIRQAMVRVSDASTRTTTTFAKKNTATAVAAESVLSVDGEQLADSIQALDVEIQFDAASRWQALADRSERLLTSLRSSGLFVRSSRPGSRLTDGENLSRPK